MNMHNFTCCTDLRYQESNILKEIQYSKSVQLWDAGYVIQVYFNDDAAVKYGNLTNVSSEKIRMKLRDKLTLSRILIDEISDEAMNRLREEVSTIVDGTEEQWKKESTTNIIKEDNDVSTESQTCTATFDDMFGDGVCESVQDLDSFLKSEETKREDEQSKPTVVSISRSNPYFDKNIKSTPTIQAECNTRIFYNKENNRARQRHLLGVSRLAENLSKDKPYKSSSKNPSNRRNNLEPIVEDFIKNNSNAFWDRSSTPNSLYNTSTVTDSSVKKTMTNMLDVFIKNDICGSTSPASTPNNLDINSFSDYLDTILGPPDQNPILDDIYNYLPHTESKFKGNKSNNLKKRYNTISPNNPGSNVQSTKKGGNVYSNNKNNHKRNEQNQTPVLSMSEHYSLDTICIFCRSNEKYMQYSRTHRIKDEFGKVTCPMLRLNVCSMCQATGDNAHTLIHCPLNKARIR